ncbi:MAG: hypothetical protein AAF986_01450 [Pseudomonadota bacterium]
MQIVTAALQLRLADLGPGASLIVWSMRAVAAGFCRHQLMNAGYAALFNIDAERTIEAVESAIAAIGTAGGQRLQLMPPCSELITDDEFMIASCFCAAQQNNEYDLAERMRPIVSSPDYESTKLALMRAVAIFSEHNIPINMPTIEWVDHANVRQPTHDFVGHA